MSSPTKLTLVIPCYNEEQTLADCVARVLELESPALALELIVVDDCSTDRSLEVARELAARHPQVKLVAHTVNRGKGAALRSGFAEATGDFVGVQDADLEYDPQEYRKLLEPLLRDEADVVFGSRYLRPDNRKVLYFWHSWMNKSLTFVSNMLTNLDLSDMETCYKLFRREIIQGIDLREDRFGFEPEVVAKVAQRHCRVWECAISYRPRSYQEGKKVGWKDGARALYCILHYSAHTATLPMQLLIYLGIGGLSALSNLLCFALLYWGGVGLNTAVVSSFLAAAMVNYLLCVTVLFRHKARWSATGEIAAYAATLAIMCGFDWGVTTGLTSLGLLPFWSKTVATLFGVVGNFLLRRKLVFPEKSYLTPR